MGGYGTAVLELFSEIGVTTTVVRIHLPTGPSSSSMPRPRMNFAKSTA